MVSKVPITSSVVRAMITCMETREMTGYGVAKEIGMSWMGEMVMITSMAVQEIVTNASMVHGKSTAKECATYNDSVNVRP